MMMKRARFAAVLFGLQLLAACATSSMVAPCTAYCTTADEGYQWAQRANLLDAERCEGYAPSFTEGCRQAVNDGVLSANPRSAY